MKIGVFDSGLGGINVLKELLKMYPNEEYIYIGDNKNLPYGTKTKDQLLLLASNMIDYLIKEGVNIIFIACGTVSSTIYEELKEKYRVPIVSIVNTTVTKINSLNLDEIAVLATPNTINSHIFKNNLNCKKVLEISCDKFVPLIEGDLDSKFKNLYIEQYLKEIKKERIKNIILGCTHYPLLVEDIKNYLGDVNCYDMGVILANSIYLKSGNKSLNIYFTNYNKELEDKVSEILNQKISIEKLDL